MGTSTLLCFAAALAFRLNHPAIQLANYLMYPYQIPFILLYVRFGEALLASPPVPFDPRVLAVTLRADPAKLHEAFPHAEIIIFGHSHRPLLELVDKTVTVMNPGGAGAPRFGIPPSVGILELEPGIPPRGRIVNLRHDRPS